MNKIEELEIIEFGFIDYASLFIIPLLFIMYNDSLLSDNIIIRHMVLTGGNGIILNGWGKYVYIFIMNVILLCGFDYILDRIKNKSKGLFTKKMILKEIILSLFFVMFIIIFIYWNFFYVYNKDINLLIIILIPYCYTDYRLLKRIEKKILAQYDS